MNTQKTRGTRWIQLAGWLTFGLGVIHVAATPLVFPLSTDLLADPAQLSALYMFEMTGIAVIFSGLLILYAVRGWKSGARWAWHTCLGAGIFLLLLGAGAILTMPGNPFAYLSAIIALVENLPVWLHRKDFREIH